MDWKQGAVYFRILLNNQSNLKKAKKALEYYKGRTEM